MKFDQDEFDPVTVKMKCKDSGIYYTSNSFEIGIKDYCYRNSD